MYRRELKERLRELVRTEASAEFQRLAEEDRRMLQADKWQCACDLLALAAFPTRAGLTRSAQWREAAKRLHDLMPPGELIDWALQQADIARNRERGVRDLRPQPDGPCHTLVLDYARMRRDKARVLLGRARAARETGADIVRGPSGVFTTGEPAPPSGKTTRE
jgi:hypothetical protein